MASGSTMKTGPAARTHGIKYPRGNAFVSHDYLIANIVSRIKGKFRCTSGSVPAAPESWDGGFLPTFVLLLKVQMFIFCPVRL
jgi:hypothetical protein